MPTCVREHENDGMYCFPLYFFETVSQWIQKSLYILACQPAPGIFLQPPSTGFTDIRGCCRSELRSSCWSSKRFPNSVISQPHNMVLLNSIHGVGRPFLPFFSGVAWLLIGWVLFPCLFFIKTLKKFTPTGPQRIHLMKNRVDFVKSDCDRGEGCFDGVVNVCAFL